MAVSSSVSELCIQLISSAFQRCRVSDDICRLSVLLKSSPASDLPIIQISISDTGIGSSLEEFQNLRCRMEAINAEIWDGLLSVTTTSFCDNEVYHYLLNLRETISSRRLTRLPSNPKNGTKFRHAIYFYGTEARLSISERLDILVSQINCFFHKNVAIEMVVEREDVPGSHSEHFFLADDSYPLPFSISNVEHLTSGLEDYVLKHGHMLNQTCNSCFPTGENLKVGNGTACSLESHRSSGPGLMMEVVLYFEDFKPCPISESLQNALTSIDWKSYGLTLGNNVDEGVISPSARPMTRTNRHLIKRAVKLALDDLKEKHAGILVSENAIKVRSYAPDLARSIAGLVLSSNDPDFQEECFSLLGLQSREIRGETVEEIIKEKIISIIDVNDKKSQRSKDVAVAPLLFEGDCFWNSNSQDMEFEEGEDAFSYFD
ncbi:hypothetical protein JCGZ_17757 [Jatropha curcas]|uniref:Type 2 DNA topoisomerase 6 subunit B-like n=1 Tax=Jatropha curcas TaxID=180498 RepID=A0A067K478_JATCU|nr:hypothetical protein JCGZ_17757 [Jatropha curcas]